MSTGSEQLSTTRKAARARLRDVGLMAGVVLAFAVAYRELATLGSRYSVEKGVETFLFAANDRAPIIVLVLSGWLAWRRRHRLAQLPRQTGPAGVVAGLLVVGFAFQAWAVHVGAGDLQAISLMAVCSALLVLGWGLPGLRALWLPVAFLAFCIPIPAPLLATWLWELRLFTAQYVGGLLYLLGIPALVSGDQILRAQQAFQVIDGCSGLRSVETLTMLVVLLVDLFGRRGLHACLLLISAPLVALALNGIRVLTLVLNPHSEIVAIHNLQGIVILLVGLLVVYGLDGLLARFLPPRRDPRPAGAAAAAAKSNGVGRWLPGIALGVAVALVGVGALTPVWNRQRPPTRLEELVRGALPETDDAEAVQEDLYFHGQAAFRESIHRRYRMGLQAVDVFVGTANLRDRRGTILSPVNSRPGSGWLLREARIVEVGPDRDPVLAQWLEKGLDRRLSWSWYLGTGSMLEETLRNLLGTESSELRREQGQLVVRLTTRTASADEPDPRAQERLEHFFRRLQPALMAAVAPREAEGAGASDESPRGANEAG